MLIVDGCCVLAVLPGLGNLSGTSRVHIGGDPMSRLIRLVLNVFAVMAVLGRHRRDTPVGSGAALVVPLARDGWPGRPRGGVLL